MENLHFLHAERGLMNSNANDTNVGIFGHATVPLFKSDIPREGSGGGGKSANLC